MALIARRWLIRGGLCLAFTSMGVPAHGQLLTRQLNLADLSRSAGVIVHGRVVEVHREGHPHYPNVSTVVVSLEVLENIRGASGQHFRFRQYAEELELSPGPPPRATDSVVKYSNHGYAVGQELVLFLYANSRYGFTSPVGGGQGRFRVLRDQRGRGQVANEFGNRGLFPGVAIAAEQQGLTLSPAERSLLARPGGSAEIETFLRLAKRLAAVEGKP